MALSQFLTDFKKGGYMFGCLFYLLVLIGSGRSKKTGTNLSKTWMADNGDNNQAVSSTVLIWKLGKNISGCVIIRKEKLAFNKKSMVVFSLIATRESYCLSAYKFFHTKTNYRL